MVDTTQKQEALQAVRLLRGHALSSGSIKTASTIEAIYQACRLLEAHIEGETIVHNAVLTYKDASFTIGQRVLIDSPTYSFKEAKITGFCGDKEIYVILGNSNRVVFQAGTLYTWNSAGSFE